MKFDLKTIMLKEKMKRTTVKFYTIPSFIFLNHFPLELQLLLYMINIFLE